jgi:chromosome segregation ATPase
MNPTDIPTPRKRTFKELFEKARKHPAYWREVHNEIVELEREIVRLTRDVQIRDQQYKEAFGAWDKERAELTAENTRLKADWKELTAHLNNENPADILVYVKALQALQSRLTATEKELEGVKQANAAIYAKYVEQGNKREKEFEQLEKSQQLISELTSALKNWINYFQTDVPKTAESSEAQGEEFTKCWFETEQALTHATAVLKDNKG